MRLNVEDLRVTSTAMTSANVTADTLNSLSTCIPYTGICTYVSQCPTLTCILC